MFFSSVGFRKLNQECHLDLLALGIALLDKNTNKYLSRHHAKCSFVVVVSNYLFHI